jgi:hypothetical protein
VARKRYYSHAIMKTLLFLLLFLIIVPLLIGRLAGQSVKSKNDLVPFATVAGILILFIFFLIFNDLINKDAKKKPKKQVPTTSAPSPNCNLQPACTNEGYAICPQGRGEQDPCEREEQSCPPALECRCEPHHSPSYQR